MAIVLGTNAADTLNTGTTANDTYFAGLGGDFIYASGGSDLIQAGYASSAVYWRGGLPNNDFDSVTYEALAAQLGLAASTLSITVDLARGTVAKVVSGGVIGTDTLAGADGVYGTAGNDVFAGRQTWDFDQFRGNAGNDTINGRGGYDGALYDNATAAVTINLAAGTATGDASVGTDTLREIEFVVGSAYADTYVATGFGGTSVNRSSFGETFNVFTPGVGDDTITGNGGTVLNYSGVSGAIAVNLGLQTDATGAARIVTNAATFAPGTGPGNDLASGVDGVRAGSFNDTLTGGGEVNVFATGVATTLTLSSDDGFELFRGAGGNDSIDGRTGIDRAEYNVGGQSVGVRIDLDAGLASGDAIVTGTDTLRGIESITGTYVDDLYDATGFTLTNAAAPSANAGDAVIYVAPGETTASRAFNEFRPSAGNDTVIGNGATRVSFQNILVEKLVGPTPSIIATYSGTAAGSAAYGLTDGGFGTVAFTGTYSVRGGAGNDALTGAAGYQNLQGYYGNDTLAGGAGADVLFGFNGADYSGASTTVNTSTTFTDDDRLLGGAGNDLLRGDFGADVLDGGTGTDTMEGGSGNDSYVVDRPTDVTTEALSGTVGGVDTVFSSVSRTLGANLERLTLTGAGATAGTGNTLANVLVGNAAANLLDGGSGNDTLTGGAGPDEFRLTTAPNALTNVDRITDFSPVDDRIALDDAVFATIGAPGALAVAAFHVGTAAADGSDRVVYNPATGQVFFDADGNGAGAPILILQLGAGLALTAADFFVI